MTKILNLVYHHLYSWKATYALKYFIKLWNDVKATMIKNHMTIMWQLMFFSKVSTMFVNWASCYHQTSYTHFPSHSPHAYFWLLANFNNMNYKSNSIPYLTVLHHVQLVCYTIVYGHWYKTWHPLCYKGRKFPSGMDAP